MKVEDALQILEAKGLILKERKRITNDTGDQLLFETGEIVNVFDKGSVNAQGKSIAQGHFKQLQQRLPKRYLLCMVMIITQELSLRRCFCAGILNL